MDLEDSVDLGDSADLEDSGGLEGDCKSSRLYLEVVIHGCCSVCFGWSKGEGG